MFRRRKSIEPAHIPAVSVPAWLVAQDDLWTLGQDTGGVGPESGESVGDASDLATPIPCPEPPVASATRLVDPVPTGVATPSEPPLDTPPPGHGGGLDAALATQVAVCWAVDHLSTALGAAGAHIKFAAPGQVANDPRDPAVSWVALRLLVGLAPEKERDRATDSGVDMLASTWERVPASLADCQWWDRRIAVRLAGDDVVVDEEITAGGGGGVAERAGVPVGNLLRVAAGGF